MNMMEFFFGTGRVSLRLDMARLAFCTVVLFTMNVLWWHNTGIILLFVVTWLVVTLLRHLCWRSHPKATPRTRCTKSETIEVFASDSRLILISKEAIICCLSRRSGQRESSNYHFLIAQCRAGEVRSAKGIA
jgi:hypothetical protein